jgi:trimethylamine:corrinoid methyltransferase-like protein
MSMALPQDVDHEKLYPVVFAEMVKNTDKPIVTTLTNIEDVKRIHEIATIERGNLENREKALEMSQLLREEAGRILSNYAARELPADKMARIDRYVDSL